MGIALISRVALGIGVACSWISMAVAVSMDAMQGAWAMSGTDCAAIFEKADGTVRFKDPGSSLNTGIIVSGDKIIGPSASCTADKIRQEGDRFSVLLNCSDAVLSSSVSMSFRMVDGAHFQRFDPSFPDFALDYLKCPF